MMGAIPARPRGCTELPAREPHHVPGDALLGQAQYPRLASLDPVFHDDLLPVELGLHASLVASMVTKGVMGFVRHGLLLGLHGCRHRSAQVGF
jgi:hypothetical protein